MSKILVLSAHVGQIDRRITAEMNSLVNSGRDITLLSIPTDIPESFVDQRVKILMPLMTSARKIEWLFRLAKKLPTRLRDLATAAWHYVGKGPIPIWTSHFVAAAPTERFDAIHCHDLPELRKIVADNNIGKVYNMESPEQIAAAIDNCKECCEQGAFSETSRRAAREKFAWKEQGKTLLQIYEELGI